MGKILGGALLVLLSLFMLLGFFNSGSELSFMAKGLTFLILVVVPGVAGAAMLYTHFKARARFTRRGEQLQRQTQESEVLRLAQRKGGQLTVLEVVAELNMNPNAAKDALMSLVTQDLADYDIGDGGEFEYSFYGIRDGQHKGSRQGGHDA